MTTDVRSGRVLFLVPARGGSRGIPGKNLQKVDGASLVARAAVCAQRFLREAALPDARIIVDTDSRELAEEARRWNAEVPFLRPASLAGDSTTTLASTLHLLDRLADDGWTADTVVLLQPTSPLRSWQDLGACWTRMETSGAESVVSVVEPSKPPQLAMEFADGNVLRWLSTATPPMPNSRRQDLARAVAPSGAVYIVRAEALRERGAFVVPGVTVGVECSAATSLDVDTPQDLLMARRAAMLGVPPSPARVTAVPGQVAEGASIALPGVDGRFLVVGAHTLPSMMLQRGQQGDAVAGGVLLLPEREAPGPALWREALDCPVALWCSTATDVAEFAPWLGASDIVAVSEGAPGVGELAGGILRATAKLRS